jgi:hypothetical protein
VGLVPIAKLEQHFAETLGAHGPKHRETQMTRDSLAIRYRNEGQYDKADELYRESGICEHLKPVEEYIRSLGVRVQAMGSYWSHDSRTWVYFEKATLDAESLIRRFKLPEFVKVHTHRGTHEGSEHGLVCQLDHDALIGVHPDQAEGAKVVG